MPPLLPHWTGPVPKSQADADALKNSLLTHAYLANKGDIIIEPSPEPVQPVPGQKGDVIDPFAPDYPFNPNNPASRTGEMEKV